MQHSRSSQAESRGGGRHGQRCFDAGCHQLHPASKLGPEQVRPFNKEKEVVGAFSEYCVFII